MDENRGPTQRDQKIQENYEAQCWAIDTMYLCKVILTFLALGLLFWLFS